MRHTRNDVSSGFVWTSFRWRFVFILRFGGLLFRIVSSGCFGVFFLFCRKKRIIVSDFFEAMYSNIWKKKHNTRVWKEIYCSTNFVSIRKKFIRCLDSVPVISIRLVSVCVLLQNGRSENSYYIQIKGKNSSISRSIDNRVHKLIARYGSAIFLCHEPIGSISTNNKQILIAILSVYAICHINITYIKCASKCIRHNLRHVFLFCFARIERKHFRFSRRERVLRFLFFVCGSLWRFFWDSVSVVFV